MHTNASVLQGEVTFLPNVVKLVVDIRLQPFGTLMLWYHHTEVANTLGADKCGRHVAWFR